MDYCSGRKGKLRAGRVSFGRGAEGEVARALPTFAPLEWTGTPTSTPSRPSPSGTEVASPRILEVNAQGQLWQSVAVVRDGGASKLRLHCGYEGGSSEYDVGMIRTV